MAGGRILKLSLRPAGTLVPVDVETMRLVAGAGAEGDRHADALSPRQLLLAGADAYRDFGLAPHALRENLLLDVDVARLASGSVLQIGTDVLLQVMFACEACGQLDRFGERLAARIEQRRGMLARVLRGGSIGRGATVRLVGRMAAWPDDWRDRVARVLDAVPPGCVVEYAQLARLAGIQSTYCRAFPSLLKKLGPAGAARAVAARAAPERPRWDGAGLFDPTPAECAMLESVAHDTQPYREPLFPGKV